MFECALGHAQFKRHLLIQRSWASLHIGFLFTDTVKEKTAAEKQREYRARRDADPVRREKYLRSERERWRRNIEAGKKKRIRDLCEKAQRWRRKKWREAKERQRSATLKGTTDRLIRSGHPKILGTSQGPFKDQENHKSGVVDEALKRRTLNSGFIHSEGPPGGNLATM